MRAVVFAYHDVGCVGLEALVNSGFLVQAVFTHQDNSQENCFFDSVAKRALAHKIPLYSPKNVNDQLWIDSIRNLKPDMIFSFYYRKILSPAILELAPKGAYNLHGSLLPAYRGRAPVNWVIVNGESETGVTLHVMTQHPDAGDIVAQQKVLIERADTALTLHQKINAAAATLLAETFPNLLSGNFTLHPQDEGLASYYGRRTPSDGAIDWTRSAENIYNLIRAVTLPYPGAYTWIAHRKLTIWEAGLNGASDNEFPEFVTGTIVNISPLQVKCGQGLLNIQSGSIGEGSALNSVDLIRSAGLVIGIQFKSKNDTKPS